MLRCKSLSPPVMLAAVVAALLAAPMPPGAAAQPAVPMVNVARLDYGLQARALAPGVYAVEGANADFTVANGCNIINTGFITTGAGVLVINTGTSRLYGEQLRALIERTTREPIVQVLHPNLHPDGFLGNQTFASVPIAATADTRAGMQREAPGHERNLYRLCGDWMKGIEARLPTTPHADPKAWLKSLDALAALKPGTVVPSHGPVHQGRRGLQQTRAFLQWLDASFARWAAQGWAMNEVLRAPAPEATTHWAAWPAEYTRHVAHLDPRDERAVLQRGKAP